MGLQGKTIQNPPGYLYALIRRHHQGTLELALAPAIAARRANRQRAEAAIAQALQPHLSEEAPKSDLSSAEVAQLPSQAAISLFSCNTVQANTEALRTQAPHNALRCTD